MTLKELLDGIDSGALPLTILVEPGFCNYPTYTAAGWTICVFDDCHEWDYIEWAEDPSGRRIESFPRHEDRLDDIGCRKSKPDNEWTEEETLCSWWRPEHDEYWGY